MSRPVRLAVLASLIVAAAWTTLTVITAVTRGEGEGWVFWTTVGLLAVVAGGLTRMAIRVAMPGLALLIFAAVGSRQPRQRRRSRPQVLPLAQSNSAAGEAGRHRRVAGGLLDITVAD